MNWWQRLRVVFNKDRTNRELDDEFRFHLDRQAEEYIAAGLPPEEARRRAAREFGAVEWAKEECRSSRGVDWIEGLWQDLGYSVRNCRRKPAFALAVIGLTAVGVGAATAVFSFVDRVLFRPLPYADSERLVSLGIRIQWLDYDFLTASGYVQLRGGAGPLLAITSWSGVGNCDWESDRPARLSCARAEASFLPVLGIRPALGRNFTPEEDKPDAPPVGLISHSMWKRAFGGEGSALGRRIALDGRQVRIIGVLPADFALPTLDPVDVLMPQKLPANPTGALPLRVYGRLKEGVTAAQARDMIFSSAQTLFTEIPPDLRKQVQFHVRSLRDLQTGDFRTSSWTLLAAVLAMLSIACANAASLLLARSVARRRELAIRVALGAGRFRIARQMLAETLLLSLAGGLAGCGLAYALLRVFVLIAPAGIPHLSAASLDARVLAFGVAASLACGLALGLAPAIRTPGPEPLTGSRATPGGGMLARRLLVGIQMAVSLVLLTAAGLLVLSLWNRLLLPLGFRTDHLVTAQVALGQRYPDAAARAAFYANLEARVRRLPSVESVAFSDSLPPGGVPRSQPLFAPQVEGRPLLAQAAPGIVVWRSITPEYFRTLGIRIVRGRGFREEDQRPGVRSIIISEAYARRLFGRENPVGKRMCRACRPLEDARNPAVWYSIVGISSDAQNAGLTDRNDPEYYLVRRRGGTAWEDAPPVSSAVVRGSGSTRALEAWLRAEIASLDPALPVQIRTFEEHLGQLAARERFQASLLALFAGIGLLLAAAGMYGLTAFLVAQRESEFGIRLALGAAPGDIRRMVLRDAAEWLAGGLAIGLAGAAAAARLLRGLLFHVSPASPAAYAAAAAVLTGFVVIAAVIPSRRLARVDPALTLRHD